jgi:hypothetical protein
MKISMSAKDKYATCSEMYRLHYIEKVRPIRLSSALVFGVAIDIALNDLLEKSLPLDEAILLFHKEWSKHEKVDTIDYFASDFDIMLLNEHEKVRIQNTPEGPLRIHLSNWLSLNAKGAKLITSYYNEILPSIKEVVSVQRNISIKGNKEDGTESEDEIIGIVDLEAKIQLPNGGIVHAILDNKTTSSPYAKNSVLTKHQTALYTYATGVKHAGFLTLNKKTFKTQIIVDAVPESLQDVVIGEFVDVIAKINNKEFNKNQKNKCFAFGARCAYYNLCWNNSLEGLTTQEERENAKQV